MPLQGHVIWMVMWWTVEIAIFALVFWMVYAAFGGRRDLNQSAEDILKHRLTSGEIDAEEYERRVKSLARDRKAA